MYVKICLKHQLQSFHKGNKELAKYTCKVMVWTEPFEGLEEILAEASNLSVNNTTVGGETTTVSYSFEMRSDRSLALQMCHSSLLDKKIYIGSGSFQNTEGKKKSMLLLNRKG